MLTPAKDSKRCVSDDDESAEVADIMGVALLNSLDGGSPACKILEFKNITFEYYWNTHSS